MNHLPRPLVTVFLLALTGVAQADTKLVTSVQVSGPTPSQTTIITYYQGDKVRVEQDTLVTLYDLAKDRLYLLSLETQTYRALPLRETLKTPSLPRQNTEGGQARRSPLKVKTKIALSAPGQQEMIVGKAARSHTLTASVALAFDGGRAGSFGGFGGRPGGGLPTYQIEGEIWLAEGLSSSLASPKYAHLLLVPTIAPGLGGLPIVSSLAEPLAAKLEKTRGVALGSRLRIQGGAMQEPIVIETRVQELSDAPLSEQLFVLPEGFTQEVAPKSDASARPSARSRSPLQLLPVAMLALRVLGRR